MDQAEMAMTKRGDPEVPDRPYTTAQLCRAHTIRAANLECKAAAVACRYKAPEPTRSILCLSAANLCVSAGRPDRARTLIRRALAGQPPAEIEADLRALLAEIDREARP
jgi:hypothetical protein